MQVLQDWNTFRWSRIPSPSDPTAKLIRMKFHVFSDSTLCVGVSNPHLPNDCATKLEDVWNEHGLVENLNVGAREVLPFLTSRNMFRGIRKGKIQNPLKIGSYSCQCSTTLNGRREAIQNLVCTMPKKSQHLRPHSNQDTGASWGPRQKIRVGTEISTNIKENEILLHCRLLTYSSVILPTRYLQRQSHYCLEN